MGAAGFEHPQNPKQETPVCVSGGAKSDAHSAPSAPNSPGNPPTPPTDPELAAIAAAWPDLPPAIRAGIVAMVKAARPGGAQ